MTTRKNVSKNVRHIKTTKEKGGKNVKRINETDHQRAMTNPEAQQALTALRASWSNLSREQRVEQLKVLIGFKGTTMAGIARDLGQPATTIRRYIKPASDWIADMEDAWAEDPQEQSERQAGQYACRFPSKVPPRELVEPVITEVSPAQDDAHISTAQQTTKNASSPSTRVEEPPVGNRAMNRQEGQVGEGTPIASQVGAPVFKEETLYEKRERLARIHDQIKPQPIYNAWSMERQGKPVPPKDPHKPVS